MSYCPSCGGVLGVDCYNPGECAEITRDMAAQAQSAGSEIADLRAQLAAAEAERDEKAALLLASHKAMSVHYSADLGDAIRERDAALARAELAEIAAANFETRCGVYLADRDRYAEALREIADAEWLTHESEDGLVWNMVGIDPQDIARAALDEAQAPKAGGGEAG